MRFRLHISKVQDSHGVNITTLLCQSNCESDLSESSYPQTIVSNCESDLSEWIVSSDD